MFITEIQWLRIVTEEALKKDSMKLRVFFVFKAIELYVMWFLIKQDK